MNEATIIVCNHGHFQCLVEKYCHLAMVIRSCLDIITTRKYSWHNVTTHNLRWCEYELCDGFW